MKPFNSAYRPVLRFEIQAAVHATIISIMLIFLIINSPNYNQ